MLADEIGIESKLRALKTCQREQNAPNCIMCKENMDCEKKREFSELVVMNLEHKISLLQACQQDKQLTSCMGCESLLDCQMRAEYVNAVYLSMNKGNGGNFDF